jgi:hypothetical protein
MVGLLAMASQISKETWDTRSPNNYKPQENHILLAKGQKPFYAAVRADFDPHMP